MVHPIQSAEKQTTTVGANAHTHTHTQLIITALATVWNILLCLDAEQRITLAYFAQLTSLNCQHSIHH